MNLVYQTIHDPEKGDCLRACVATLLQLPIADVPNFIELQGSKWFMGGKNSVYSFLERNGYEYLGWQPPLKAIELSEGVNGLYIASVDSANFPGKRHSVIFKGKELFHDPTTKKKWQGKLDDVREFWMIERVAGGHDG